MKPTKTNHHLASGCAAALVTCWAAAPVAADQATTSSFDFTLSTNLSVAIEKVQLIYGLNASGLQSPNFFSVGSIGTGPQSRIITLQEPAEGGNFPSQFSWGLIGTFGTEGISVAAPASFSNVLFDPETWDGYFGGTPDRADVRLDIGNVSETALVDFFNLDFPNGILNIDSNDAVVYNFDLFAENGSVSLTIVPEPSSSAWLLSLSALGCTLVRRRRSI